MVRIDSGRYRGFRMRPHMRSMVTSRSTPGLMGSGCMARIRVDSKAAFQTQLERRLGKHDKGATLAEFARQYFAEILLAELVDKDWAPVLAALLSSWKSYSAFDGKRPTIRVFNPTVERDGYAHSHTVVEVACRNIPFLLDSIRIELNQQNLVLADVEQCLMSVVRDRHGKPVLATDEQANETLIRLELARVVNTAQVEKGVRDVIRLVQRVVDDFAPMRQRLLLWSDEIGTASQSNHSLELQECYAFLTWIYANNFTFLGYEELVATEGRVYRSLPGTALGLTRKGFHCSNLAVDASSETIAISKVPIKSRVHRPAYLDCMTIRFGEVQGKQRLCRIIGLFTASVYNQSPAEIPIVRQKMAHMFDDTGLAATSHKGRELNRIVEVLPREELFLASAPELSAMVTKIAGLQERRIVRVLVRKDRNNHFVNCLVFVPKDIYNTELRVGVQALLSRKFRAIDAEFTTLFSESALTRTHFVLRVDPDAGNDAGTDEIEKQVAMLTRTWEDDLHDVIVDAVGKEKGESVFALVKGVFPPGYRDDYWPVTANADLDYLLALSVAAPLSVNLYEWVVNGEPETRFKVFHLNDALPLSDVIPILENLGAKAIEEHPYELHLDGKLIWLHDFVLQLTVQPEGGLRALKADFEEAFKQIWRAGKENDGFNRLVPGAGMDYREVSVIRAYARYFGQLQSSFGQAFIADCVTRYHSITRQLLQLFQLRFDPGQQGSDAAVVELKGQILSQIEAVVNLADDRVLRRFVEMIMASVRTNYYQRNPDGGPKDYIAIKFLPALISEMPLPKPKYEIFVYSPDVEGLHLRGGKVARGGLRWSDRTEDYRTEILGLVKAQQVKNSVIVPVGAKGGFLPKRLPVTGGRDAVQAEGIRCYRVFIQGLLDLTDNLVKGKVVPPRDVVRYDDDDYYLVVAADKGTAAFSDIANEISGQNQFWLGDAFASGGSVGYDHKAMGITARGAWLSVQQHFRELAINDDQEDFSVVGIGDMAGDVFGNGMLMSRHICLVAAFNHQHIFIDPAPNAAAGFKERKRLFALPRSSWADYNRALVSKGGGVFDRSAKSIAISAEMKKRFGIGENSLTPNRLISHLLQAEVDLLWNGGIGTYVKSRLESHLDVGDKSNDAVRVNGGELRCRVIGEGGNLGMTQLARVEYCLQGGLCFTDFIDNAGGVNCSDVEVNIKILLNQLVEKGKMKEAERKRFLGQMSDEVAAMVLNNNYHQAQAINLMQSQSVRRGFEYLRVMHILAEKGGLDPQLEYLPSDDELQQRRSTGQSFTNPELAVLTSYQKGWLKQELAESHLLDEPWLAREIEVAFPPRLLKKYGGELKHHRLRREIIATQIANGMVNRMGVNFVTRMSESTGVEHAVVAKAYIGARDIFEIDARWAEIRQLDYKVAPAIQREMMLDLIRLVRRTTRWLLRNRRQALVLDKEVPFFGKVLRGLVEHWELTLSGTVLIEWQDGRARLIAAGVGERLAGFVAGAHYLYGLMGIAESSRRTGVMPQRVATVYFGLGEKLGLHWFSRQIHEYQASTHWEALARETLQDDLNWQQVALTLGVLAEGNRRLPVEAIIDQWIATHRILVDRWMRLQTELRASTVRDAAVFTVAIRELLDLAQSSGGAKARF